MTTTNRDNTLPYTAHEADMIAHVACDRWRTFVDVGAHVGTWLYALRDSFDHAHAIEPNVDAVSQLVENLAKWKMIDRVQVHGCAVSSNDEGKTTLYCHDHACHSTILATHPRPETLGPEHDGKTRHKRTVDMLTLDTVLKKQIRHGTVDLVKIDVEGAELSVLTGAEQLIEKQNPYFIIECHTPLVGEIVLDRMNGGEALGRMNNIVYCAGRFK